jgi:hypothetical protein
MTGDPIDYISDAIRKIEAGHAASESGSHVAGIFGKAARAFEKEVCAYLATLLRIGGLDYEVIRPMVSGVPFAKLTLGNCVAALMEVFRLRPALLSSVAADDWTHSRFIDVLKRINDAWVQVKHGDEVGQPTLLAQMKSMLMILTLMKSGKP